MQTSDLMETPPTVTEEAEKVKITLNVYHLYLAPLLVLRGFECNTFPTKH